MAEPAATQFARIMTVLPELDDDQDHLIEEIAGSVGISPVQFVEDLRSITKRFDERGLVDGFQIIIGAKKVSLFKTAFHRPMRLTMSELCALELGLSMLRQERPPYEHELIDRVMLTLQAMIASLDANAAHEGLRDGSLTDSGNAEHLALVRQAVQEHRMIRMRYRASGESTSHDRTICPQALLYAEHMWYVIRFIEPGNLRRYRLDRIEQVELLDECFEPEADVLAQMMQHGRAFASDTTRRMTVRYSPKIARWVAEREGRKVDADGSLTLEHPVADDTWAVRHVLQYGPEAEVLGPPEVRAMIRTHLEAMG